MRSAFAIFMSLTEAITYLSQLSPMRNCKERMGAQRGTKVAVGASTVPSAVGEKAHLRKRQL